MTAFWMAFVAAALAARPILALLRAMKSRQTIDPHAPATHQVKQGTPTMGGIVVLIGMVAGILYAAFTPARSGVLLSASLATILFGAIGFVDDYVVPRIVKKRGLGWRQKILMQLVAATLVALPITGLSPLALAAGVFVVLFLSNAYNFADGLDGLAAGIGLAYCAGLFALATSVGSAPAAALALVVAGGLVVFLFLNAHPAKIFMGDVGSLPIGAVLAVAVLALPGAAAALRGFGGHGPSPWSVVVACLALNLMLFAELVPVPIQVFWYKRTGRRIFPATPIHHGFEKLGWPETRVVAAFTLVQLLASALAFTVVGR